MNNPLLEVHELPPFSRIKAQHVRPAITELIEENRRELCRLLDAGADTFESLVMVREELDDRLGKAWSPVSHMNGVVNSDELREAYNSCLPLLSEYSTDMGQDPRLYAAYKKILDSDAYAALGVAQKKAIENALRDFRLKGIELDEQGQQRFKQISRELSELTSQFNDNVLDATEAWCKTVTDAEMLQGMPISALALARQTAEQRGEQGYMLTLDIPSYIAVMDYCDDAVLRREVYEAFTTRASDQGPHAGQWDNSTLMTEILSLRNEGARLLGFANYAEQSLATKMADTPEQVLVFLEELGEKSKPAAEAEYAEICEFASAEFGVAEIEPWDVSYFAEKLKKQKFDISDEELKPYFSAPVVIDGMFEVVRRLYDIEITQTTIVETWHADVRTYDIRRTGQTIARFFLDLYARPKKQGGAWMDECRVRRMTAAKTLQLPVAYLTCNFTAPVGDNPALLTHDEVVTLFHEFGHGLHHMMTTVECADVSGINGVAWDAVELPSQFMENWCWEKEALQFLSSHYVTGEPLPEEMLDKLLNAKNFRAAMGMVRQLEFALFDFRLHLRSDAQSPNQIQDLLNTVRTEVAVIQAPDTNRFQHAFSHIFGGGYAAGYYSYKWAEVLSADAFAKFAEDGIFNRQTGEEFLGTVLEQGGSRDAMELFVSFRGREPSVDALLKQDGII